MLETCGSAGRVYLAALRHRSKITKGPGSRAAGLAMAVKLIESAQDRRRAASAPHLVALVRAGATFINGKLVERPGEDPQPRPSRTGGSVSQVQGELVLDTPRILAYDYSPLHQRRAAGDVPGSGQRPVRPAAGACWGSGPAGWPCCAAPTGRSDDHP